MVCRQRFELLHRACLSAGDDHGNRILWLGVVLAKKYPSSMRLHMRLHKFGGHPADVAWTYLDFAWIKHGHGLVGLRTGHGLIKDSDFARLWTWTGINRGHGQFKDRPRTGLWTGCERRLCAGTDADADWTWSIHGHGLDADRFAEIF